MSENEELQEQKPSTLIQIPQQKHDDAALASVSCGDSRFLPRLQLMTMRSSKVSVDKFPANHFALIVSNNLQDIGEFVDILLIAWRPKALDTGGDDIITCYDPKFDEDDQPTGVFADIAKRSMERDSGCMYGPEYLVYLPAVKKYATFFCGSITLRFEAPAFSGRLGNAATLKPYLIKPKPKKGKTGDPYYSTKVHDCVTVIEPPDQGEINKVSEAFLNPPEPEVETASADEAKSTERAQ